MKKQKLFAIRKIRGFLSLKDVEGTLRQEGYIGRVTDETLVPKKLKNAITKRKKEIQDEQIKEEERIFGISPIYYFRSPDKQMVKQIKQIQKEQIFRVEEEFNDFLICKYALYKHDLTFAERMRISCKLKNGFIKTKLQKKLREYHLKHEIDDLMAKVEGESAHSKKEKLNNPSKVINEEAHNVNQNRIVYEKKLSQKTIDYYKKTLKPRSKTELFSQFECEICGRAETSGYCYIDSEGCNTYICRSCNAQLKIRAGRKMFISTPMGGQKKKY